MSNARSTAHAIAAVFTEVAQAGIKLLRFGGRTLQGMSWPALLVACLAAAFLLTILPLALTLFAFFLLIKLAIGCFLVDRHERRSKERQL
ncbi:MAG: hypothetical protein ACEQSK_00620 [Sphingomonadaceae bacterium]